MNAGEQQLQGTSAPVEQQLALPGALENLQAMGVAELPHNANALTRRQLAFCIAFLRTGSTTDAAREAGYSDPLSDGSKAKKNPEVSRFLAAAMAPIAKSADQLIQRVWQRSQALHAMLQEQLDKPETLRSQSTILKLTAEANKTDALLGTLLGKITGINVTGEVSHKMSGTLHHQHNLDGVVPVPAEALAQLAQMRRDVVVARRGEGMPAITGGQN